MDFDDLYTLDWVVRTVQVHCIYSETVYSVRIIVNQITFVDTEDPIVTLWVHKMKSQGRSRY